MLSTSTVQVPLGDFIFCFLIETQALKTKLKRDLSCISSYVNTSTL